MGPTLVFSKLQVLLSHLCGKEKKREKKEKGKEGKRNRKGKEVRKEEGIKKKKEGEKWKRNFKKSFAGFKLVWSVLLFFLSVKREGVGGGIGFTFLPS